ncbi:MAG: hypothetical protein ACXW3L_03670 [Limisphaerales bacterium]
MGSNPEVESQQGNATGAPLQADGNVLLGGAFTTVSGVVRPRVSRLFGDVLAPSLNASLSSGSVTISWPLSSGFVLDESLSIPGDWWETSLPYTTNVNIVSVSSPGGAGNKIYRLRKL